METKCGVTCVIPFYSEGERIFPVLEIVNGLQLFDQIICIDDGSGDDTLARIRQRWPRMTVVRMPENGGKAAAIRKGLQAVDSEFVMLMGADMQHLEEDELREVVQAVGKCPDVDMIILRRLHAEWFDRMNRADILLSGERILRTDDLRAILDSSVEAFPLEVAINDYMERHEKTVRWMPWTAVNAYRSDKRGLLDGFSKDFTLYTSILRYVGIMSFARQMASFARQPLQIR